MEWLFIYMPNKHKLHINDPRFYCHYDLKSNSFKKDNDYVSVALGTKFCPATKEQRDILFQKMHEAGYMWVSENKQVLSLKAEPEPIGEIKGNEGKISSNWTEEDEERFQHSLLAIKTSQFHPQEDRDELVDWLKSLKAQNGGK